MHLRLDKNTCFHKCQQRRVKKRKVNIVRLNSTRILYLSCLSSQNLLAGIVFVAVDKILQRKHLHAVTSQLLRQSILMHYLLYGYIHVYTEANLTGDSLSMQYFDFRKKNMLKSKTILSVLENEPYLYTYRIFKA